MVALPGQLFTNTQIPACIWFLTRSKTARGNDIAAWRDRAGETLFIDARNLGYMKDRVLRDFSVDDIKKIAGTFHAWKRGEGYANEPGCWRRSNFDPLCRSEFDPGLIAGR
jgi:type I restriction enzyme M protein